MTEETERLAGGWALTGFAGLCAGWWLLVARPWPLFPLGLLFIVHGVRSFGLWRGLTEGSDEPGRRKAHARTVTLDAVLLAVVVLAPLLMSRYR